MKMQNSVKMYLSEVFIGKIIHLFIISSQIKIPPNILKF